MDVSADTSSEITAAARQLIPVADLTEHHGNVREDLNLTDEFKASIAAEGVRIPLLVTTSTNGGWLVIEGHRRLAAAIAAGITEIPCDIDLARADDEAGQYLDMVLANGDAYRSNLRQVEEAAALFAAHEAGASRTRLRKATGRTAMEIKAALAVGGLPAETRTRASTANDDVTLDQIALLAEFNGDEDATERLIQSLEYGYPLEHAAERIRQERVEAAEHDRLVADLQAAGIHVTDELPSGAAWLTSLQHDSQDLTPEAHASCPGRGATFRSWNLLEPLHYCASPAEHGHISRYLRLAAQGGDAVNDGNGSPDLTAGTDPTPGPDRRLVITGNKAWQAAAEVRHRWLADNLFARRSAPRDVHEFIASQLLAMPVPLHSGLANARHKPLFGKLTGRDLDKLDQECRTASIGRLAILALAPIVTAYEHAMTETDGRNTWRTDRYGPCPRADAGTYLTFLASLGYQLSDIESAVTDGVPYTGTVPLITVLATESDRDGGQIAA